MNGIMKGIWTLGIGKDDYGETKMKSKDQQGED